MIEEVEQPEGEETPVTDPNEGGAEQEAVDAEVEETEEALA